MRLEIHYRTEYRYDPAVRGGLTALRLCPRPRAGVDVVSAQVRSDGGRMAASYVDGWGTRTDLVEVPDLHSTAAFEVDAVVETSAPGADEELSPAESLLYRETSSRVRLQAVVPLGWHVAGEGRSWSAVESALQWIPQRFSYDVHATDACTRIEQFIEQGAGVCQDFAHVFLALLRSWGWAARYVSGYLFSGEGDARTIEAEAMHAWVEAYQPGRGWIGLDPTTGTYTDDRFVPVAVGRDYDDVRPVRGVFHGTSVQSHRSWLRMEAQAQQ